jgi:hypothetical protein
MKERNGEANGEINERQLSAEINNGSMAIYHGYKLINIINNEISIINQ